MGRVSRAAICTCRTARLPEYLANFTGTGSPYKAASYCYHLGKASDPAGPNNPLAHGRDDWYLPAVDELEFIYDQLWDYFGGNYYPDANFVYDSYVTSTEQLPGYVWTQVFSSGGQYRDPKNDDGFNVRCVARGSG